MIMITRLFNTTANLLLRIAEKMRLTYNEVNIIVYYMIVPLTWCVMLDFIVDTWPIITLIWIAVCVGVILYHRKHFSDWCDWAFLKSQDFLLWFQRIGWDYFKSSVIICVVLPLVIYMILIYLLIYILF